MDLLIGLCLLWGGYQGYRKGLLLEIVGVVAFVVSVVLGFKLLHTGLAVARPYVGDHARLLPYFGFSVVFFPLIFLVTRLGRLLRRSIRYTMLGSFDNLAGGLLGVFTWALLVSTVLWGAEALKLPLPVGPTKTTYLVPLVKPVAPAVFHKIAQVVPSLGNLLELLRKQLPA